jgi:hypothetical protein
VTAAAHKMTSPSARLAAKSGTESNFFVMRSLRFRQNVNSTEKQQSPWPSESDSRVVVGAESPESGGGDGGGNANSKTKGDGNDNANSKPNTNGKNSNKNTNASSNPQSDSSKQPTKELKHKGQQDTDRKFRLHCRLNNSRFLQELWLISLIVVLLQTDVNIVKSLKLNRIIKSLEVPFGPIELILAVLLTIEFSLRGYASVGTPWGYKTVFQFITKDFHNYMDWFSILGWWLWIILHATVDQKPGDGRKTVLRKIEGADSVLC